MSSENTNRKKVLIFLTKGLDNTIWARSALMHATAAAMMGQDTTLYCAAEGAQIMTRDAPSKEKIVPGRPTLAQRLEEAKRANVKFKVCEAAAKVHGFKHEDFVDGVTISGAATLIDMALDYDTVLSF